MLYSELLNKTLQNLTKTASPPGQPSSHALDIQILIEHAFGISRDQFWMQKNRAVTDRRGLRKFKGFAARLMNHEPVAYIIKEKSFYNTSFFVNKNVLIPRPETEILVEKALDVISSPIRILDIGAGSGNIAITLVRETASTVIAVEKDVRAFRVLRRNIDRHGVQERVFAMRSDLFPPAGNPFDMIVSNPPYVSEEDWEALAPGVRKHEPRKALVSGEGGYEIIRRIIRGSGNFLKPGGWLMVEIGYGQKSEVEILLRNADYRRILFEEDYSGIPRVACAQK